VRALPLKIALLGVLACGGGTTRDARPARPAPVPVRGSAPEPAGASARDAASLDDMIAEDMAPDHGVPWSTRRLVWTDFRGQPPANGEEGARTAHGLYYVWSCRGETFRYRVRAAFHPLRSWVKPMVAEHPVESARVLRHEQGHFDLSEVFARRIRKRFDDLTTPCALNDSELGAMARQLVEEERATQRRYDAETRHSLIEARQTDWENQIRRWLATLAPYDR
jgi:hypothetical protein